VPGRGGAGPRGALPRRREFLPPVRVAERADETDDGRLQPNRGTTGRVREGSRAAGRSGSRDQAARLRAAGGRTRGGGHSRRDHPELRSGRLPKRARRRTEGPVCGLRRGPGKVARSDPVVAGHPGSPQDSEPLVTARDLPLRIAGEEIATGAWIDVRSPWSGELFARVAKAGPPEVERAIAAAAEGFGETRALPAYRRAEILRRLSHELEVR